MFAELKYSIRLLFTIASYKNGDFQQTIHFACNFAPIRKLLYD